MDQDLYNQILFKFYASMRYELYQKIQDYWEFNEDEVMPDYERRQEEYFKSRLNKDLEDESD